jgi:flagellar biosynthesis/type III secretory pathway protein FliH
MGVNMKTSKENSYNAEDMSDEYREGFKEGYAAGFHDGRKVHNKTDEKREVG